MGLEIGVPEVLRMMLLADEESGVRRGRVRSEGQRERDMRFAAIRAPALPLEEEGLEIADAGTGETCGVGLGIGAVQHQHGQPFPLPEIIAHERAEAELAWAMRRNRATILPDRDQLDEGRAELDQPVFSAPGCRLRAPTLKPRRP